MVRLSLLARRQEANASPRARHRQKPSGASSSHPKGAQSHRPQTRLKLCGVLEPAVAPQPLWEQEESSASTGLVCRQGGGEGGTANTPSTSEAGSVPRRLCPHPPVQRIGWAQPFCQGWTRTRPCPGMGTGLAHRSGTRIRGFSWVTAPDGGEPRAGLHAWVTLSAWCGVLPAPAPVAQSFPQGGRAEAAPRSHP